MSLTSEGCGVLSHALHCYVVAEISIQGESEDENKQHKQPSLRSWLHDFLRGKEWLWR